MRRKHNKIKLCPDLIKCLNYFVTDDPNSVPWSEIMFIVINILHLVVASFFILVAYTGIGWHSSLEALEPGLKLAGENLDLETVTTIHHFLALLIIVLALVGLNGAIGGYEALIYSHMALVIVVLGLEMYISFAVGIRTDNCFSSYEKLKKILKQHVNGFYYDETYQGFEQKMLVNFNRNFNFGSRPVYRRYYTSTLLMGDIQKSLGCCGYDSYYDYLNESLGVHGLRHPVYTDQNLSFVVPPSCCRSRWAPNLYCAANITRENSRKMSKKEIENIIHTEGCSIRIMELCNSVVRFWGRGVFFVSLIHTLLFFLSIPTVIIQVKILRKLALENTFTFSIQKNLKAPLVQHNVDEEEVERERAVDEKFQQKYHRDQDFVMNEETLSFVRRLKREHGILDEYKYKYKGNNNDRYKETDYSNLPNALLIVRKKRKNVTMAEGQGQGQVQIQNQNPGQGQSQGVQIGESSSILKRNPSLILSKDDKSKLKDQKGRFNYFLNPPLLKYAGRVLNRDHHAGAEKVYDLRETQLVGGTLDFYKQVLEAKRKAEMEQRQQSGGKRKSKAYCCKKYQKLL